MGKGKKYNLFYLAEKGLIRFKFSFFLKLFIIVLWGLLLYNLYMLNIFNNISIKDDLYRWISYGLFIFLNFLVVVLIIVITTFTLRLRKDEFGLCRCSGGTRGEIFILILNESSILSLLSITVMLIVESFILYYFKPLIMKFLNVEYNLSFILELLKGAGVLSCFIFTGLLLCYIPFGLYYAFKDPYNIVT